MDLHYSQTSNFKVRSLRSDSKFQAFKKVNGATTLRRATTRQHYYIIIFCFCNNFAQIFIDNRNIFVRQPLKGKNIFSRKSDKSPDI